MTVKKNDGKRQAKSKRVKRSRAVRGRRVGARLEDVLWKELRTVAEERKVSVPELLNGMDIKRKNGNPSSATRPPRSRSRRKRR